MTHFKLIMTLLAGAAVGLSQTPPAAPAPPAPPAQPAMPAPTPMPAPMAMPAPVVAPVAPRAFDFADLDIQITPEIEAQIEAARDRVINLRDLNIDREAIREQVDAARDQVRNQLNIDREAIRAQVDAAREQIRAIEPQLAYARSLGQGFAFAPQITPMPPTPPAAGRVIRMNMSSDRAYSAGQSALDSRHWDDAVNYFGQVINRNTTRVDGALYWKAYALAKLGRSSESLAAIAELRKSYGSSRWMDDAKALEIEVNQAAGKPISPDAETDEDLKVLALESLSHSDAERAFPALEKILKAPSSSPKLKRNALYVLADNKSPKAQSLLEQIARGGANPDLQVKAISYMPRANSGQVLTEIYTASNDNEVKRAVLNALVGARDKDRLLGVLRSEKNSDLRSIAYGYLGGISGNPELWQLYQTETTVEGKEQILNHMYNNGNAEKLLELLRTEKEPKLRVQVVRVLGSYRNNSQITDALVALYPNEQDAQVKQAIIDAVYSQRNGKAMVDLAKSEKDSKMKLRLVDRLGNMKNCKECSDYLVEILNR